MPFYGQWNPKVDEVLLKNYFEGKNSGLAIECGAADGIGDSCCKYFEEQGWKTVNIEANPSNYARLVKNRTKSQNINAVLSKKNGRAHFRNDAVVRLLEDGENIPYVETISYATLLKRIGTDQIDLFVLDVEGHEPYVLEGMVESGLPLPKVFCIEYPYCTQEKINKILGNRYRYDGLSFNNVFLSQKNIKVRTPLWGRTEPFKIENNHWVYSKHVEY